MMVKWMVLARGYTQSLSIPWYPLGVSHMMVKTSCTVPAVSRIQDVYMYIICTYNIIMYFTYCTGVLVIVRFILIPFRWNVKKRSMISILTLSTLERFSEFWEWCYDAQQIDWSCGGAHAATATNARKIAQ